VGATVRPGAPDEVLSGFPGWRCLVSSSRGGRSLADDVPILKGRVVTKVESAGVSERLTITVPRFYGRDWLPGAQIDHPLARYGQELQVSVVVESAATDQEWTTRIGRFLITDWDDDDTGVITVTGASLLRRVADDRLTSPMQPRVGGTFVSEARRLLPPGMSAAFDSALVDRPCPAGMSWSEDRLAALQEIADAWPARLRTDEWGQVRFRAPLAEVPVPVLTFTDGTRGTMISAPRSDTRSGAYNVIVARSSNAGREDVQAVVAQATGPMAASGEYGAVTKFWASPLLESFGQAQAAATTMLRNSTLPAQTLPVRLLSDPRIELDDAVQVVRTTEAGDPVPVWGWVTGVDLPLTVNDGDMRVDVGVAV
jgi:hypothetical protein